MDVLCFYECITKPINLVLGGITLAALLITIIIYKYSHSYKSRVRALYAALGLIPIFLVFSLGNFECGSWMSCTHHILGLATQGLLVSTLLVALVYYLWGSQLCVKAINGKHMKREIFSDVYDLLDSVCANIEIKPPELYFIESSKPKAIAVSGSKKIIILSVGAFELLNEGELKVVLAHEVAHLKNKHPLIKFISRFLGFSYVYGFSLSKDLEREQEKQANDVAEKVVDRKTLLDVISIFDGGSK